MNKFIECILQFHNTFGMLLCVLLFAMSGSYEGMLMCGIFGGILFIVELTECLRSFRNKCKDKQHERKKNTRS